MTSPLGAPAHFESFIQVPNSTTQNPVTVQVLGVKTCTAIKLLPTYEEVFIMMLYVSQTPDFTPASTRMAFLTINTDNFTLNETYQNMFSRHSLRGLDFTDKDLWKGPLNAPVQGARWYELLRVNFFENRIYYHSDADLLAYQNAVQSTLDALVADPAGGWYTQVKNVLGIEFMRRNAEAPSGKKVPFLKWLYKHSMHVVNTTRFTIQSNLPISSQIKVYNKSQSRLRFVVPPIGHAHSLDTLFNTIPDIAPRTRGMSTGAGTMPKDPFTILQLHSTLCKRSNPTGRVSSTLLTSIFTGDEDVGFKRDSDLEQLPLALRAGYQAVVFEIKAQGLNLPLQYSHPETARTEVKLGFRW